MKERLLSIFNSTYKENREEIDQLLDRLNYSVEELKEGVLHYTFGIGDDSRKNELYRESLMPLVLHFHNLIKTSYHQERQKTAYEYLEKAQAKKFIDIGYGAPGSHISDYLQDYKDSEATLADQDKNAEKFSKMLFEISHPSLTNRVKYLLHNMNSYNPPKGFDTYLMLDSIEHCDDPTKYLHKLVETSPEANFIFSIPICSKKSLDKMHFYEWITTFDADNWLSDAGLEVLESKEIFPKSDTDYFTEFIEGGFFNYFVLCRKR